ncbi:hypothetical protein V8E36_007673 [Tilletia maclaganii]
MADSAGSRAPRPQQTRTTAPARAASPESIDIKPDPDGQTADDAIPIPTSDDSSSSSSDDEDDLAHLPPLRKQPLQPQQPPAPPAPKPLDIAEDPNAPDWERASYFASQRAYADLAHYFRSGNAYFVALTTTPWEASPNPTDILDIGWAYLKECLSPLHERQPFDWVAQCRRFHDSPDGFKLTTDMYNAAERVCTSLVPRGTRAHWEPHVVYYQPTEGRDCFNEVNLPNHKRNFIFSAFADKVRPKADNYSNVFSRHVDGVHFDRQVHILYEFNRRLKQLSRHKPVFLLTHCMKEDIMFLANLGIEWQDMNLSSPLSPWFDPKDDADWLRSHRYWHSAWDFAKNKKTASNGNRAQTRRQQPATSSSSPSKTHGTHDTLVSERRREKQRQIDPEQRAHAEESSEDDEARERHSVQNSYPGSAPSSSRYVPPPRDTRPVTQSEFYRPGSIHVIDLFALIEVLPHFSERSASYYPNADQRRAAAAAAAAAQQPASAPGSTATTPPALAAAYKEAPRREKAALRQRRDEGLERARTLLRPTARHEKHFEAIMQGLQATAIRSGILRTSGDPNAPQTAAAGSGAGDGNGEQFKWWNAGNEAMFMLAVLGKLVDEHPLPDRPPTPPPRRARSTRAEALPHRPRDSRDGRYRERNPRRGILQPPSQQREAREQQQQQQQQRQRVPDRPASGARPSQQPRTAHPLPARPTSGDRLTSGAHARRPAVPRNETPEAWAVRMSLADGGRGLGPAASASVADRNGAATMTAGTGPGSRTGDLSASPRVGARARPLPPIPEPASQPTKRARPQLEAESQDVVLSRTAEVGVYSSTSSELSSLESEIDEEDEDGGVSHAANQFTPFYYNLQEMYAKPAIYIALAYRNAGPAQPGLITEVGYCILDASKADRRESLQISTWHYLVKDNQHYTRQGAQDDFSFAARDAEGNVVMPARSGGASSISRQETMLPSGTRVATKRNITKHLHGVLTEALKTDRRVFAVNLSAEEETYHMGHQAIISPQSWPAFFDWRTQRASARLAESEGMFMTPNLLRRMFSSLGSHGAAGSRQIFSIEVKSVYAAVNPDTDDPGPLGLGAGEGARARQKKQTSADDDRFANELPDVPFPLMCDLLDLKPDGDRKLENPGNEAYFCMQAMLEFAYGPAKHQSFKDSIRARKEALEAKAVEAQI